MKTLIKNVNKIVSYQYYNFIMKKVNKKDKNKNFGKNKLGCTKRRKYKKNIEKVGKVG